jgi:ABC-type multidrug transport system fused ATPase/permease subunit
MSAANSKPDNLIRFLSYVKPYRWRLALSTLVGVLKYNLPVVFPWILKDIIDNLLAGKPSRLGLTFDELMSLSVLLFTVYAAISYLRTHIADRLSHVMIFDLRRDLFHHLQKLPLGFFQDQRSGAVSSRLLTDVAMAQNFVGLAGTNLFMDLTSLASITAVIFLMDWRLALVACSTLPIYYFLQRSLSRRMRANAKEARRRMEVLEGTLHETVSGISEIKSFTGEEDESRRFLDRCRSYLEAARESIRMHSISLGTTALLTRIPPVLVLWFGGHLVLEGELTVGALMAFYAYLELIYNPLNRLSELNLQLANSRTAIDRLFELFDCEPEEKEGTVPPLTVRMGEIQFEGVTFAYRSDCPVFRGLGASIAPGGRVALVGRSGAGKSTLIKLLIRFHVPQAGRILIDGQDISMVSLQSLRSQIALVQQDPVLFSGSIEDNIRIGRAEATLEEIREAAREANALSFIEELPDGFQTEVGERGVKLSGGQKQRIAMARAFLKDAPILVLDESTSSLDAPTEELVHEALERLLEGRTTIIIAHRLSTVARADRILVLDGGAVVEQGTHEELLGREGSLYRALYRSSLGLREDWEAPPESRASPRALRSSP